MFSACSNKTKTVNLTAEGINLFSEGPLFEGSNTATADWKMNEITVFDGKKLKDLKVEKATVKSVSFLVEPEIGSPQIDKIIMEMAASETSMARIALFEGSVIPGEVYNLQIAEIQKELEKFFLQDKITFVADVSILDQEYYDDLNISFTINFELEVAE